MGIPRKISRIFYESPSRRYRFAESIILQSPEMEILYNFRPSLTSYFHRMFPRNASWHQRAARALIAQSDSQVPTFLFEKRRRTVHHRESSAGVWDRWWMDRRQNCCDESAVDLPRPPAVLYPAQSVGRGRLVRKTEDAPERALAAASDALRGVKDGR